MHIDTLLPVTRTNRSSGSNYSGTWGFSRRQFEIHRKIENVIAIERDTFGMLDPVTTTGRGYEEHQQSLGVYPGV